MRFKTLHPDARAEQLMFCTKIETLRAVIEVFVVAYNRFGTAKFNDRRFRNAQDLPFFCFIAFIIIAFGRSMCRICLTLRDLCDILSVRLT